MARWPLPCSGAAPDIRPAAGLGRANDIHHRLCFGACLDEIIGLRQHALAEGVEIAIDHRDALALEQFERFLLDREPVGPGIDRRLLRGVEESFAQFRIHAGEGGVAEIGRQRREIVLRQRIKFGGLEELAGDDGRRIVLEAVEHAGLQCRVDFTERQRRRGRPHQAQAFGDHGIGQGPDLEAGQILGRFHRLPGQHAARAEIIGPGNDPDVGALEQRVLDRLGRTGVESLGLLRKAGKEIAEIVGTDQRHEVRRDRGARHHEVDDAELDRIDDVDFLAQLVVGKERDLDLLAQTVGLQVLDQVVVIDAAIGVFGIVGLRRRQFQFHGGGFGAPDQGGRQSKAG